MTSNVIRKALASTESLLTHLNDLFPVFDYLYNWILGGIQRINFFLIRGLVKNSNYSMTALFLGTEESAHQFARLAYSQIEKMTSLGKFFSYQIDPTRLPNIEIIAVRVRSPFVGKFLNQNYLLLRNVIFSLDLRRLMVEIIERMNRNRRRDIKELKSCGYSYTIFRNNEKAFDLFYWKMYVPHTKNRFGKAAYLEPYLRLKNLYSKKGGIIFVEKDKRPITGILFQTRGKKLYALRFGVYKGDQNFLTDLAGQDALLSLIEWAKMKGMESFNYGVTAPFFNDGIFMYKKSWGMSIEKGGGHPFCALKLNYLSEGSLSFLQQNPFIFIDGEVMKGVVFLDHRPMEDELEHIFSKYFIPKLDSLIVITYHNSNIEDIDEIKSSIMSKISADRLVAPLSNICLLLQRRGFNVDVFVGRNQTP